MNSDMFRDLQADEEYPDMIKRLQEDEEYNAWLDQQELYALEQEHPEDY